MKIDIIGGSYENTYNVQVNPQKTINWFISEGTQKENNKEQKILLQRPGLKSFSTITGSKVRGIAWVNDLTYSKCFAVIDDSLYEISKDTTATLIGTLTGGLNSTHKVEFVLNSNHQLLIIDNANTADYLTDFGIVTNNGNLVGHVYNISTDTLTELTLADHNFPNESGDTGRVHYSDSDNFLSWNNQNVFTPLSKADPTLAVRIYRGDMVCFGRESIEGFYNNGSDFVSREGSAMPYGIVAPQSAVVYTSGIVFLGGHSKGQAAVYNLNSDYKIDQLSPFTITNRINQASTLSNATGFIQYSKTGHAFYYLTIPDLDTTLIYDLISGEWVDFQSLKSFPNADGSWDSSIYRGWTYTNFDGINLFGDYYSGNIFLEDNNTYTDNGKNIIRERISQILQAEYKPLGVNTLELDITKGKGIITGQGSEPRLMVSDSQNGGVTFDNERYVDIGAIGNYKERIKLFGFGTTENWAYKFRITDPVNCNILSAIIQGSVGIY
ncbi:MAG: hypothetical protein ACFFD1_00095 [Candidatus Thorarchaeota archaeon]